MEKFMKLQPSLNLSICRQFLWSTNQKDRRVFKTHPIWQPGQYSIDLEMDPAFFFLDPPHLWMKLPHAMQSQFLWEVWHGDMVTWLETQWDPCHHLHWRPANDTSAIEVTFQCAEAQWHKTSSDRMSWPISPWRKQLLHLHHSLAWTRWLPWSQTKSAWVWIE